MSDVTTGMYAKLDEDETVLVQVTAVADGKVEFHPQGGGPVYAMPVAEFEALHRAVGADEHKAMAGRMRRAEVEGDWFPEEKPMRAWVNDMLWNGWVQPCFEKDEVLAAIADARIPNIFYHEKTDTFVEVDSMGEPLPVFDLDDVLAQSEARGDDAAMIGPSKNMEVWVTKYPAETVKTPEGKRQVYWIGAGSWTWSIAEDRPAAPSM